MRVTGYVALGTPPELDFCRLISTYEIDIPPDIVATSTPHLSDSGDLHLTFDITEVSNCPTDTELSELNKTYTKHDLSNLLQCSTVKHRSKQQRVNKRKCASVSFVEKPPNNRQCKGVAEKTVVEFGLEMLNTTRDEHVLHKINNLFCQDRFKLPMISDIQEEKLSLLGNCEDHYFQDMNRIHENSDKSANSPFPLIKICCTFPLRFLKLDKCDAVIRQFLDNVIGRNRQIRMVNLQGNNMDQNTYFAKPENSKYLLDKIMLNDYLDSELEEVHIYSDLKITGVCNIYCDLLVWKVDNTCSNFISAEFDNKKLPLERTGDENACFNFEPVCETEVTFKGIETGIASDFDLETNNDSTSFEIIQTEDDLTGPYRKAETVIACNDLDTQQLNNNGFTLNSQVGETFVNCSIDNNTSCLSLETPKVNNNISLLEEPIFNNTTLKLENADEESCFNLDTENVENSCFKFTGLSVNESVMDSINPRDKNNINDACDETMVCNSQIIQDIYSWKPTPPKKMKYALAPQLNTAEKTVLSDNESDVYWDYYETGLMNTDHFPSLDHSICYSSCDKKSISNDDYFQCKLQDDRIGEKGNNDDNSWGSEEEKHESGRVLLDYDECYGCSNSDMTWDSLNSRAVDNDSLSTDSSDIGGDNYFSVADFDNGLGHCLTTWDPNLWSQEQDRKDVSNCVDSVLLRPPTTKTQHTTVRSYECEETRVFKVNNFSTNVKSACCEESFKSTFIRKSCYNSQSSTNILRLVGMQTEDTEEEMENMSSSCSVSFTKKNNPSKLPRIYKKTINLEKKPSSINLIQNKTTAKSGNLKDSNNFRESHIKPTAKCRNAGSKLPVLNSKTLETGKLGTSHWSEKYISSKQKPKKEGSGKVNIKNPNVQLRKSIRHLKLPPIHSVPTSVTCSDSSGSDHYHDNDNMTQLGTSQDDPSKSHCHTAPNETTPRKVCRSLSDSVTLNTCRAKELSRQLEVDDVHPTDTTPYRAENYIKPIDPWRVHTHSGRARTQSEPESYDPYKSAERQMLELLEPEKNAPKLAPISPVPKSPAILSSPTSAFTKFSPIQSPSPLFISEDDNSNLTSKSSKSSENSDSPLTVTSPYDNFVSSKDSNQNPISLSTLSLCSTISIESVDSIKNGNRMGLSSSARVPEKKTPVPLRRTASAFESRRTRDPLKGKLKMEDMLYGTTNNEKERYFGSPIITGELEKGNDNHSSSGSLYKTVSDAETLNAEQELLKSMSEFEKLLSSSSSSPSPSSPPLKLFPSLVSSFPLDDMDKLESDLHISSHVGGPDSAYSSLNRKSPVGGEQERDSSMSEAVPRF
ncbi:uncharacterized protein LOC124361960 isoform X3 [Homalodisca vitripennis]|uniref:uncharacterized protein LOC124361960 isoform X3 n=1 Tax=Homalodisca vitripennis TaxID=197043 RepID=UPI001EEA8599|nr:uncharacterized protein LOC124361960 isoform X3 [Homalodisca vitripennis]